MDISSEFRQMLGALRGRRPWLYLDSKGSVTIGVGHHLPDLDAALRLPFIDRATGERASEADVRAAWAKLTELREGGQHGREFLPEFYRDATGLVLGEEAIDELLAEDVAAAEAHLRRALPGYDGCPAAAREALVEMALHHGAGFPGEERWEGLREALLQGDFARAAPLSGSGESSRLGEERNAWRAARLERAARDRAIEISIEEKLSALVQSLNTLADVAMVELKKIEVQVGELAEELVQKARGFLDDLAERAQAAAQNLEVKAEAGGAPDGARPAETGAPTAAPTGQTATPEQAAAPAQAAPEQATAPADRDEPGAQAGADAGDRPSGVQPSA